MDLKSDERFNDYKLLIQKLEDQVDKNYEISKNYLNNNNPQRKAFNKSSILNEVNKYDLKNNFNNSYNGIYNGSPYYKNNDVSKKELKNYVINLLFI